MALETQRATKMKRKVLYCLWLASTLYCAAGFAQPSSNDSDQRVASRAMLEFLTQFNDLDEIEFDLITAFAEKDAQLENNPEEKTDSAPTIKSNTNLEQQDKIDD